MIAKALSLLLCQKPATGIDSSDNCKVGIRSRSVIRRFFFALALPRQR